MDLPLETDRLILRPFREADAHWFSAPTALIRRLARYQGWDIPFTFKNRPKKFIREMLPRKTRTARAVVPDRAGTQAGQMA